jgi:hypothetical protein
VPQEIALEFAAVLEGLRTGTPATVPADPSTSTSSTAATTVSSLPGEGAGIVDEGYLPDDAPAARVNAYVAFACRDAANNPGPPATAPLGNVVADTALDG